MASIPPSFECPITYEVMVDPVSTADGHTFERRAIEGWFAAGHATNPNTGGELASTEVVPNHALRNAIEEHLERTFKITQRSQVEIGQLIGSGSFKTAHMGKLRGQDVAVLKMRPGAQ